MVVGQTLTTTNGTWTNSPTSFTYKWYKGITAIVGATSSTYILVQADAGTTTAIKCEVTAINLGGSTAADSNTLTTVYDADAQAFITAAVITVLVQMTAINELTIGLKADSLWTSMKALYPFVGGTATQHKYNLKNPLDTDAAFRLVFNGGWTHSSTGATPNGTNAYADTKLIPNTTLSLNSTHISGYLRTNLSVLGPILSAENAVNYNNGLYIWPKALGVYYVRINDDTSQSNSAGADIRGLHLASRTASNVKKYRFNNTQIFNVTTASTALNTSSIYIGASRNNANYFNNEIAFSSIGDGLTDTDATNFYTAVQTFQTTLGRQV
jgi:hypothetical protein